MLSLQNVFMDGMEKSEWFEEWFNTPFYHILYQNRNNEEADKFVQKITEELKIRKGSTILDLACGKGRHAISLNKLGYKVVGSDLSVNSISNAKKYENETLRFIVHDMREPIKNEEFGVIFNMFTSIGYFDETDDNVKVMSSCYEMLKKNGLLVIDFMNVLKAANELVNNEVRTIDDIQFKLTRSIENQHIVKTITFGHTGQSYTFTERVQMLTLVDFKSFFSKAKLKLEMVYGGYDLSPFDEKSSERLIMVASKK